MLFPVARIRSPGFDMFQLIVADQVLSNSLWQEVVKVAGGKLTQSCLFKISGSCIEAISKNGHHACNPGTSVAKGGSCFEELPPVEIRSSTSTTDCPDWMRPSMRFSIPWSFGLGLYISKGRPVHPPPAPLGNSSCSHPGNDFRSGKLGANNFCQGILDISPKLRKETKPVVAVDR